MNWYSSRQFTENDERREARFFQDQRRAQQIAKIKAEQSRSPPNGVRGTEESPNSRRMANAAGARDVSPASSSSSTSRKSLLFGGKNSPSADPGLLGVTLASRLARGSAASGRNSASPVAVSPWRRQLQLNEVRNDRRQGEHFSSPRRNLGSPDHRRAPNFVRSSSPGGFDERHQRSVGGPMAASGRPIFCPETPYVAGPSREEEHMRQEIPDVLIPETPASSIMDVLGPSRGGAAGHNPRRRGGGGGGVDVDGKNVGEKDDFGDLLDWENDRNFAFEKGPRDDNWTRRASGANDEPDDAHLPEPFPSPESYRFSQDSVMCLETPKVKERMKSDVLVSHNQQQQRGSGLDRASGKKLGVSGTSAASRESATPPPKPAGDDKPPPPAPPKRASTKRPLAHKTPEPHVPFGKRRSERVFGEGKRNGKTGGGVGKLKVDDDDCLTTQQAVKKLDKFLPDTEDFLYVPRSTISGNRDLLFRLLGTYISSGAYADERKSAFEKMGIKRYFNPGSKFFLSDAEEEGYRKEQEECNKEKEYDEKEDFPSASSVDRPPEVEEKSQKYKEAETLDRPMPPVVEDGAQTSPAPEEVLEEKSNEGRKGEEEKAEVEEEEAKAETETTAAPFLPKSAEVGVQVEFPQPAASPAAAAVVVPLPPPRNPAPELSADLLTSILLTQRSMLTMLDMLVGEVRGLPAKINAVSLGFSPGHFVQACVQLQQQQSSQAGAAVGGASQLPAEVVGEKENEHVDDHGRKLRRMRST